MSGGGQIVAAISRHEMALEIMKGATGLSPPDGVNPEAVLAMLAKSDPRTVNGFYRAADRVMALLMREMNGGRA